ncbi:uncharacterized protein (DUF1015 family) [Streptosporangium album]|uniref:Uncharacterized protein (DUF1015 family) n=1 Tax=Streptosporangium album TaxID=47479 RepID=A0A7W7WCZ0_9ACTN|nr:DUF1015 domain-containing protein [Streptosporangium album]MBB4942298.1 uncharacterized protein (DUF1015 family) [Streptosporangium album]
MANPELPVPDGLVLRPFRALRFTVDDLAKVTSPPYDLIAEADVRELLDSHPNNVVRLILPGTDRHRYGEARETLRTWLSTGVLVADETPAVYVYEQTGPGVLQRGLIGDVGLVALERQIILPHEDVMPGPVADRLALMRTTEANLEPIFLLYEGDGGMATLLVNQIADSRAPLVEAETRDGVRHRLWAITNPHELASLDADLRTRKALIADGHHRYATYLALQHEHHTLRRGQLASADDAPTPERPMRPGPWDFGLALLVDSNAYPPDLKAIHRVIPGLPLEEAVTRAKRAWHVHEHVGLAEGMAALKGFTGPAYLLSAGGPAYLLTNPDPDQVEQAMPTGRSARWRALNTSVLAEFLLPKIWGMNDNEQSVRIVHHDPEKAVRLAHESGGTAVLLNPLTVDDVLAVAAQRERVPRKSTSFGPKPRTGLVLRTFTFD